MSTPFRDDVEILGLTTRDNGDGTSSVSLRYRETGAPTSAPQQKPVAPPPKRGPQQATPKPDTKADGKIKIPWTRVFLAAIGITVVYAIAAAIVRLN